jgi:hypothetical protein
MIIYVFIRYELVPMRWSDVKKYGLGPAQVNMVINDVMKCIILLIKQNTIAFLVKNFLKN